MKSPNAIGQEHDLKNLTIPEHVAIIMDGNGRWAKAKGLPRLEGHRIGVGNIRPVLECLAKFGVKYVTLFAFSTENWKRPAIEVEGIMTILQEEIYKETEILHQKGVRVIHLGETEHLSPQLQQAVANAQDLTKDNEKVILNVAFDYGGRSEILEAVKRLINDCVPIEKIDERLFSRYLYTANIPDPDLIVRTGGELRLSNFLLWQSAYSEYYSTSTLWPDISESDLKRALIAFSQRQRRFGTVTPEV